MTVRPSALQVMLNLRRTFIAWGLPCFEDLTLNVKHRFLAIVKYLEAGDLVATVPLRPLPYDNSRISLCLLPCEKVIEVNDGRRKK
jgi:hypothetical protein